MGNVIYQTGSIADENLYRYRGYRLYEDTGLYYISNNYYDPIIGRFISPDDLFYSSRDVLVSNLYEYVSNNPITYLKDSIYTVGESRQNYEFVYTNSVNTTKTTSYISNSFASINTGYLAFRQYNSDYYGNLFVNIAAKGTRGYFVNAFKEIGQLSGDKFAISLMKSYSLCFMGYLHLLNMELLATIMRL